MANPTPRAVETIRDRVVALGLSWANQTDADILAALQADLVDNPNPRPVRPRMLREVDLMTLLTDPDHGSVARLLNWVNFSMVQADIRANDHGRALTWIKVLPALDLITSAEAEALAAYIQEQVPDPDWREQLTVMEWALGRPVDLDDIAVARAAGRE
jgi:hypothetical protein